MFLRTQALEESYLHSERAPSSTTSTGKLLSSHYVLGTVQTMLPVFSEGGEARQLKRPLSQGVALWQEKYPAFWRHMGGHSGGQEGFLEERDWIYTSALNYPTKIRF